MRVAWKPTPVFLPGEPGGQRSLVGYTPWGHKESDMTERLNMRALTPASLMDVNAKILNNPQNISKPNPTIHEMDHKPHYDQADFISGLQG